MKTKITRSNDAAAQQKERQRAKTCAQNFDPLQEHCGTYSVVLLDSQEVKKFNSNLMLA